MTKKCVWFHHNLLSVIKICLCIILFLICGDVIVGKMEANRYPGGWKRVVGKETASDNINPEEFSRLALNNTSLYVSIPGSFEYSLNRLNGGLQWQYEIQDFSYPPAFGNRDRMFLSVFDGGVYAVDQKSGREVWRFRIPEHFKVDTEAVVSDGFVYFGGRNATFYALDEATGRLRWTFQAAPLGITQDSPDQVIQHFGQFSVDDHNLYLNNSTDNTIYALDKKTGKEMWRFANYGFELQKPIIYPQSIAFWSNTGTFYILSKTNGNVLHAVTTSRDRVVKGYFCIFIITSEGGVACINTTDGTTQWIYQKAGFQPTQIREVARSRLVMIGKNEGPGSTAARIIMVDSNAGKSLWTQIFEVPLFNSIAWDEKIIFIIGLNIQCAYDMQGNKKWCSYQHQNGTTILPSQDVLYLVSDDEKNIDINCLDIRTGSRKWTYSSPNVNTENIDVIKAYEGNLYFISKDKKSIYMLNGKFTRSVINNADIRTITDKRDSLLQIDQHIRTFVGWLTGILAAMSNKHPTLSIDTLSKQASLYEPYELTIHLDDTQLSNKYDDVKITGTFSNNKDTYTTKAFYYDKNTWKIRFVPTSIGKWNFVIRYNAYNTIINHGTFDVSNSDKPDFISISKKDPRLFMTQNGNVFIPIGIQDCVRDVNQDGNPLNQWFPGTNSDPLATTPLYTTSTMDSYLSTYAQSGFNMFRWGAENCSFPLWKTLSPSGNRYALDEGAWLDTLFSSLRNHSFHVWMSLFSFKLPFDKTLNETQKQTLLSHYLDYIVARYAGYVDVWELTNEIPLDDATITFMSNYIRSIDPYHHPITTSWEQLQLPTIDIASVHWYSGECNEFCEGELRSQLNKYLIIKKPLVFSEQGNSYANWDVDSAARLRVRLWIGYFNKAFFIFWNLSRTLFTNENLGPSNIYIGPVERQYISVFHTLTASQSDSLTSFPITSKDKVYAFLAGQQIIGYVYRSIAAETQKTASIVLTVPERGIIQWIDPATGSILSTQSVEKGYQTLVSPQFSSDIVFKIRLQE